MKVVALLFTLFLAANSGLVYGNFFLDEPEPEPGLVREKIFLDELEPEPELVHENFFLDDPEPELVPENFFLDDPEPVCKDDYTKLCEGYKLKKEACDKFGNKYCKVSCDTCSVCEDEYPSTCDMKYVNKPCNAWAERNCRKTCGICPKNKDKEPKPKEKKTKPTPTPAACEDRYRQFSCKPYKEGKKSCDWFGKTYCKKSCGTCPKNKDKEPKPKEKETKPTPTPADCKDEFAYACLNANCNVEVIRKNCAKTCFLCSKKEGCLKYDDESNCTSAEDYCSWDENRTPRCQPKPCVDKSKYCKYYRCTSDFVKERCPKKCEVCKCKGDIAGYCEKDEIKRKIYLSTNAKYIKLGYDIYRRYIPYCCQTIDTMANKKGTSK